MLLLFVFFKWQIITNYVNSITFMLHLQSKWSLQMCLLFLGLRNEKYQQRYNYTGSYYNNVSAITNNAAWVQTL